MTKNLVAVTSERGVGCTFLDWSLLWLSGQTERYIPATDSVAPLVADPLTGINAHQHAKNIPRGLSGVKGYLEKFAGSGQDLLTMFIVKTIAIPDHDLAQREKMLRDPETRQQMQAAKDRDYALGLDYFVQQGGRLIYVYADPSIPLYHNFSFRGYKRGYRGNLLNSSDEAFLDYCKFWFDSVQGDHTVWNLRELIALTIRPFDFDSPVNILPQTERLWIGCQDLWFKANTLMPDIMHYVGIKLDSTRWDHWLTIYRKWRDIQARSMKLDSELDQIVQAILEGQSRDISWLNFREECIIQHCLIYRHDVNIRANQLVRFPADTAQLHELLEPNHHDTAKIY